MSGTIFTRATMRARTSGTAAPPVAGTGFYVPETVTRMFPGTAEMSVVMVGRLLDIAAATAVTAIAACNGPVIPANPGGWELGYDQVTATPPIPRVYLGVITAAGVYAFAESRTLVAEDEGKVHRFVATSDVGVGAFCYTNGNLGGSISAAVPTFLPAGSAPDVIGVIGSDGNLGLTQFDVMDIAVLDRALSAREVADLDDAIRATGGVPDDFAAWVEMYRAERVVNHSLVIDVGGQSAGRGWPAVNGVAPVLSSMLIRPNDWGGNGT